jgi:hypothetical protein
MGFLRYSEPELRVALARAIAVRWPGERIVIVTPCEADPAGPVAGMAALQDLAEPVPSAPTWAGTSDAFVAATPFRLIYQERLTHAVLIRAVAVSLGIVAMATLFFGTGLTNFAVIATVALVLWTACKLTELLSVGRTAMDFGHVDLVDPTGQQIMGTVPSGGPFRVRVPDPSDFRVIVSLLHAHGEAAA